MKNYFTEDFVSLKYNIFDLHFIGYQKITQK